jgi:hypothetical protein
MISHEYKHGQQEFPSLHCLHSSKRDGSRLESKISNANQDIPHERHNGRTKMGRKMILPLKEEKTDFFFKRTRFEVDLLLQSHHHRCISTDSKDSLLSRTYNMRKKDARSARLDCRSSSADSQTGAEKKRKKPKKPICLFLNDEIGRTIFKKIVATKFDETNGIVVDGFGTDDVRRRGRFGLRVKGPQRTDSRQRRFLMRRRLCIQIKFLPLAISLLVYFGLLTRRCGRGRNRRRSVFLRFTVPL